MATARSESPSLAYSPPRSEAEEAEEAEMNACSAPPSTDRQRLEATVVRNYARYSQSGGKAVPPGKGFIERALSRAEEDEESEGMSEGELEANAKAQGLQEVVTQLTLEELQDFARHIESPNPCANRIPVHGKQVRRGLCGGKGVTAEGTDSDSNSDSEERDGEEDQGCGRARPSTGSKNPCGAESCGAFGMRHHTITVQRVESLADCFFDPSEGWESWPVHFWAAVEKLEEIGVVLDDIMGGVVTMQQHSEAHLSNMEEFAMDWLPSDYSYDRQEAALLLDEDASEDESEASSCSGVYMESPSIVAPHTSEDDGLFWPDAPVTDEEVQDHVWAMHRAFEAGKINARELEERMVHELERALGQAHEAQLRTREHLERTIYKGMERISQLQNLIAEQYQQAYKKDAMMRLLLEEKRIVDCRLREMELEAHLPPSSTARSHAVWSSTHGQSKGRDEAQVLDADQKSALVEALRALFHNVHHGYPENKEKNTVRLRFLHDVTRMQPTRFQMLTSGRLYWNVVESVELSNKAKFALYEVLALDVDPRHDGVYRPVATQQRNMLYAQEAVPLTQAMTDVWPIGPNPPDEVKARKVRPPPAATVAPPQSGARQPQGDKTPPTAPLPSAPRRTSSLPPVQIHGALTVEARLHKRPVKRPSANAAQGPRAKSPSTAASLPQLSPSLS